VEPKIRGDGLQFLQDIFFITDNICSNLAIQIWGEILCSAPKRGSVAAFWSQFASYHSYFIMLQNDSGNNFPFTFLSEDERSPWRNVLKFETVG